MADFTSFLDHIPAIGHIHDHLSNHLIPFIEEAAEEASDEIAETAKDIAEQHAVASDALVEKKTGNALVLSAYVIIPAALVLGALAIKIVYGMYTKSADAVGNGLKGAAAKVKNSIGTLDDATGEKKPAAKKRMLFGEILKRFVASSLTDEDIARALAKQKEIRGKKMLGELLVDIGAVTKSDVSQALKIQERAGKG